MLIHNKDNIQFVIEFPVFWDTLYKADLKRVDKKYGRIRIEQIRRIER